MMLVLVTILMVVGPLAAILFFIAAPIVAGLLAYDSVEQNRTQSAEEPVAQPEVLLPATRIEQHRATA